MTPMIVFFRIAKYLLALSAALTISVAVMRLSYMLIPLIDYGLLIFLAPFVLIGTVWIFGEVFFRTASALERRIAHMEKRRKGMGVDS